MPELLVAGEVEPALGLQPLEVAAELRALARVGGRRPEDLSLRQRTRAEQVRDEHGAAGDLALAEAVEHVVHLLERVGLGAQGDLAARMQLEELPEIDPAADEVARDRRLVGDERHRGAVTVPP